MAAYGGRLRRYFARRAPAADTDDLVQDVFLRLEMAGRRGVISDVERYLFTIARNVLISQRRNRAVRRWAQHQALDDTSEPTNPLSPERILSGRQDYARFVKSVDELPPRARTAFRLHHFEDLSRAAIAARMGISEESVKELLHRAAVHIAHAMRPES
jgi:RNA polymerase sigma-70 factor (ECF subfamily)